MKLKFLCILGVLALLLGGCGTAGPAPMTPEDAARYEATVTQFLERYRAMDPTVNELTTTAGDAEFEGYMAILCQSMTFEVGQASQEHYAVYVDVTVNNIDFGKVYDSILAQLGENAKDDDILARLEPALQAPDAPRKDFPIRVELIPGESPLIRYEETLLDALSGGFISYLSAITEDN